MSELVRAELEALLAAAGSGRAALKRAAAELEGLGPAYKQSLAALAAERGVALPEGAASWPAKRLLRRALDRSAAAQVRRNPIRRDEAFTCAHCGAAVPPGGARVRDHCPRCLRSLHVDIVPGDRASACGGLLDPSGLERVGEELILRYRCRRCGQTGRCRAHPGDDPAALAALSAAGR